MSFHPAPGSAGTLGVDPGVPAPPPGPGAAPPFASPPTDRDKRRMWIGLGVGGLVLLLCVVGGIVGIVVLLVSSTEQAKTQAGQVVAAYLDAVLDDDYDTAHQYLCGPLAAQVGVDDLEDLANRTPFSDYELEEARLATYVDVLAHLQTSSGERDQLFSLDTEGTQLCILRIAGR
jgi:hypothetical protein